MDRNTKVKNKISAALETLTSMEASLKSLSTAIEALDREIGILTVVEGNLVANLNVLKRTDIITLAELYKKTKSDLETARNRRKLLSNDRESHLRSQEKAEQALGKAREHYGNLLQMLDSSENNVISVKFGRQDGQE